MSPTAARRAIATLADMDDNMSLDEAIELNSDTEQTSNDVLQRYPGLTDLSDRERANIAIALLVSPQAVARNCSTCVLTVLDACRAGSRHHSSTRSTTS